MRKTTRIIRNVSLAAILITFTATCPKDGAKAEGSTAEFTRACEFTSSRAAGLKYLTDGLYQGAWQVNGDYADIRIHCPQAPGGIMVAWGEKPEHWFLLGSNDGDVWQAIRYFKDDGFKHQYASLEDQNYPYIMIMMPRVENKNYSVSEIKLHAKGQIPDDIQIWQPTVADARLMMISAHADDESVFFSGVLPTYATERCEDTVVIYMAANDSCRSSEALSALWAAGVKNYPVFAPFEDEYSESLQVAESLWGGREAVVSYLTEQIRKYKPEVILTHDLEGEYGHGAHMLTASAALEAAEAAANGELFKESADGYGVWDTPKLYLHLYDENQIQLDFDIPLEAFGGLTAWQVAEAALQQHASQLHWQVVRVHSSGKYPANLYGLARTKVGSDSAGGDLFENIPG